MRKYVLALLIGIISSFSMSAEGSKILVFRNTGELNIFNSDSITRVELSVYDADSVAHDEFVSQVFHRKNGAAIEIPLAEIDSVAFGYRNVIELKKNVRRLSDDEASAISSFNGQILTYDSRLTLRSGETVYYDCITERLPIGLCVKVNNAYEESGVYKAAVTMLSARDVFDRYLLTGEESYVTGSEMTRANDYGSKPFEFEIPDIDSNGVRVGGKVQVNVNAEMQDIVADFTKGYYHAAFKFSVYPRAEFTVRTDREIKLDREFPEESSTKPHIEIPALGRTINLDITLDAFLDILAEAGIQYEFGQEYAISVEWTRRNGENYFTQPVITPVNPITATQKNEVYLDGEVFLGGRIDASINTVFDIAGAGVELKFGPRLKSVFGFGVIQELSRAFNHEAYAKAHILFQLGLKTETYYCHRNLLSPGERNKIKLPFESEIFTDLITYRLFPEFNSRAVMARETAPIVQTGNEDAVVGISTYSETEVPYPLDISFEIADRSTDNSLAETEVVNTIEAEKEDFQTVYADIEIPSSLVEIDRSTIIARPVINYIGYKIKAVPTDVAGDMVLSPIICSTSSNSAFFVSGMIPVSQHTIGEYTYIEGNPVGALGVDKRFRKRTFRTCEFIDVSNPEECKGVSGIVFSLLGTWKGKMAGENVTFVFTDSNTGFYNDIPFTYLCNSPQRGGIAIRLNTGGTISFSIIDIAADTLTVIMKGTEEEVTLNRQN